MTNLLEVEDLHVTFSVRDSPLYAVRGISFRIEEGESVGIVGESGSGKTATVQAINRLSQGRISGKILFSGKKISSPGKQIGMVFQDPMTSLNPSMKIWKQIAEGLLYHKIVNSKQAKAKAFHLLKLVGISNPEVRAYQYPHEFSGGMRQRVLLAIALACNPRLLIADEPTTALDVTIQSQIIYLIKRLQKYFQMSLLIISHDMSVIARTCERVLVMYAGKIVEQGLLNEILKYPKHPYTKLLLSSLPKIDEPRSSPLISIEGSPPDLKVLPKGCAFKDRCPFRALKCEEEPKGPIACWRVL